MGADDAPGRDARGVGRRPEPENSRRFESRDPLCTFGELGAGATVLASTVTETDIDYELSGVFGRLVGPAGGVEPAVQVAEHLVLDGDLGGARLTLVPDELAVVLR